MGPIDVPPEMLPDGADEVEGDALQLTQGDDHGGEPLGGGAVLKGPRRQRQPARDAEALGAR